MSGRDAPLVETLARVVARAGLATQPPLLEYAPATLTAAVASLACGGAERIVLDWAQRAMGRHRVRLIVLRDVAGEWTPPSGLQVHRLGGRDVVARLESLGAEIAADGHPLVLCHLLREGERRALERRGAQTVNASSSDSASGGGPFQGGGGGFSGAGASASWDTAPAAGGRTPGVDSAGRILAGASGLGARCHGARPGFRRGFLGIAVGRQRWRHHHGDRVLSQCRMIDLDARAAKRIEAVPQWVIEEALAKLQAAIDSE